MRQELLTLLATSAHHKSYELLLTSSSLLLTPKDSLLCLVIQIDLSRLQTHLKSWRKTARRQTSLMNYRYTFTRGQSQESASHFFSFYQYSHLPPQYSLFSSWLVFRHQTSAEEHSSPPAGPRTRNQLHKIMITIQRQSVSAGTRLQRRGHSDAHLISSHGRGIQNRVLITQIQSLSRPRSGSSISTSTESKRPQVRTGSGP